MNQTLSTEQIDRIAHRRAAAKLGWYSHAALYVVVNIFVFAMSQYALGHRPWSVFPLLGWGLGLALHGIAVFVLGGSGGLRERMVKREREKLLRERGGP